MYYEYWDLNKPPFDNVPDPTMYAECHASMENTIAESLFAIEEGEECIAVIVGDVGLGKTMSIRMIIDSLDQEKHKIALVTNPSTTFLQILREIIGQLTGKQCEEKKKVDVLEAFNSLLFKTVDEGKKVLIFIDEANSISPSNLENLRLLTNMQEDNRNLFTIVLVGQVELAKRLEHPKRANLFQRIGTYNRIEKIQSEDLVKAYVETRLKHAGSDRRIFTGDTFPFIWEYSEHGVPRLINKICKLSLKAGETNQFSEINEEVVKQIGERFQRMSVPAIPERKPRKKPKNEMVQEPIGEIVCMPEEKLISQEKEDIKPLLKSLDTLEFATDLKHILQEADDTLDGICGEDNEQIVEQQASEAMTMPSENNITTIDGGLDEIEIGNNKIRVNLSSDFIRQAKSSNYALRAEMAGDMAARTLKENPQLTECFSAVNDRVNGEDHKYGSENSQMTEQFPIDPVPIWEEIKDFILCKIGQK